MSEPSYPLWRHAAEPALLALEPGLERVAARNARTHDATIEARCY